MQDLSRLPVVFLKVILTIVLTSLIGVEREIRNKVAGLRTHVLVGMGSCLIVLTAFHISDIYNHTLTDPTRIISNIVTGIGFLCAGTIIRGGGQIIGLTTAATLWIVSGIGMAIGAGDYVDAIVVTATSLLVLIGLRSLERMVQEYSRGSNQNNSQ